MNKHKLLAESCEDILSEIRLQLTQAPDVFPVFMNLLRGLLMNTPPSLKIKVFTHPRVDTDIIAKFIVRWGASVNRVSFEEAYPTSIFAQDNAKVIGRTDGERQLLCPHGNRDFGVAQSTSRAKLIKSVGLKIFNSKLSWEGGNILHDGVHCLIGAQTIAKNMFFLKLTQEVVIAQFEDEFLCTVNVMGDVQEALRSYENTRGVSAIPMDDGQADFHLDLDIALLGDCSNKVSKPLALIADYGLEEAHLDCVLSNASLFSAQYFPEEQMQEIYLSNLIETMKLRKPYLIEYKHKLESLGYECVPMPDFRIARQINHAGRRNLNFNYVNVLMDKVSGKPTVYYLEYGLDELDQSALAMFNQLGLNAVAINPSQGSWANDLMFLQGGLHCAVSKLA